MTIEEITQTLQTVVGNQAQVSADIGALREQTEKLASASQVLEEAAALHQQVLRNHEARQQRMEESFQTLVELASATDGRLDSLEEGQAHTESRLDALIDAQIQLTQRVDTLTSDIAAVNGRVDRTGEHLDRLTLRVDSLAVAQSRTDEQIAALGGRFDKAGELLGRAAEDIAQVAESQRRTDEQIRALLERNGSTKPGRKTTKIAKKKATKKTKGK